MIRRALYILSLILITATAAVAQHPNPIPAVPPHPTTPQEILLLFSGDKSDERILLTLNNNRNAPLTTSVIAVSANGSMHPLSDVDMIPGESKQIELAPLLRAANVGIGDLGWIRLNYNGVAMEMGAQLTLYPLGSRSGVDSPRSLSIDFKSTKREAVFWLPRFGHVVLGLANTSQAEITVDANCASVREKIIVPPGTSIIKNATATGMLALTEAGLPISCSMSYDGSASALRAVGTVRGLEGYAAPVRFYDPTTATFSNLTSVGLRSFTRSFVTVSNITDHPIELSPQLREATLENPRLQSLPPVQVEGHHSVHIPIDQAMRTLSDQAIPLVTLTIKTDAPKGSIVGAVTQIGDDQIVEDIPLRTSNPPAYARGSYPIRWDEDYKNIVTVANTASQRLGFGATITAGNMVYVLKREPIDPGATVVVDVDKLKRDQVPDMNGKTLPLDAQYGKFHWIELGGGKNAGLLGRTSVSSVQNRRRSSFSCPFPCAYSFFQNPFFDTSIFWTIPLGQSLTSNTSQYAYDIYGYQYFYPISGTGLISVDNPSAMSYGTGSPFNQVVGTPGQPGTTNVDYLVNVTNFYQSSDGESCFDNSYDYVAQGPAATTSCAVPDGESTSYKRQVLTDATFNPTASDFLQTLTTAGNDNDATVTEQTGAIGDDQCHFYGSLYSSFDHVTGGTWSVGRITPNFAESQVVISGSNQWGPDEVGFSANQVRYYQQERAKRGLAPSCSATIHQVMRITCPTKAQITYVVDDLSAGIDSTGTVNCRAGVCSPHTNYQ